VRSGARGEDEPVTAVHKPNSVQAGDGVSGMHLAAELTRELVDRPWPGRVRVK
jgi:hypothetical protein